MSPLISFSMPVRNHLDMTIKSIKSIIENVSDINNIEILIRIDNDDEIMINNISSLTAFPNTYIKIGDRKGGWIDNHHFHTENCKESKGQFIQLWSDDLLMTTPNFDKIIQHKYENKTCVVSWKDGTKWVCAPMISRNVFEITGAFGKQTFCDTYLCEVGSQCEIYYYDENIELIHDRFDITGNNEHDEYKNQQTVYGSAIKEYKSEETKVLIKEDVNQIKKHI